MNAKLRLFWRRTLGDPRSFFAWFALMCLAAVAALVVADQFSGAYNPPPMLQAMAVTCLIQAALGLVIGMLGFLLAWIPPIRPKLAWVIRRSPFLAVSFFTVGVLFFAEENWRAKRAWDDFIQSAQSRGEKFDVESVIPSRIPDEQNLAFAPTLRPALDFFRISKDVQLRDTNALAHLEGIRTTLTADSRRAPPSSPSFEKGVLTDLEAWAQFYRGNSSYPQPVKPGKAAADILEALGKFDDDLKELQREADSRPGCLFPIEYEHEMPFAMLLPHLSHLRGLCGVLQLRAIARLDLARSEEALSDLKLLFRLSDSIRDDPLIIDHLVRSATLQLGLQTVREGLARKAWNDAQLNEIERYLMSVDLLAEYGKAMRGERAFGIKALEYYRRKGMQGHAQELFGPDPPGFPFSALGLMPNGWYYRNMLAIFRLHQDVTLASVDAANHRVYPQIGDELNVRLSQMPVRPWNIFARLLMPALDKVPKRTARTQTFVNETRLACALERCRHATGQLPQTLDLLSPLFIDSIPQDIITGAPLRYRRDAGEQFTLYSVGWNEKDDGGQVALDKRGNPSLAEGDWVWASVARSNEH